MTAKTFQLSELRSMPKVRKAVYEDGHINISSYGNIEFVMIPSDKFHEMERELKKLKNAS